MLKSKKILLSILVVLVLLLIPNMVKATEQYTATSTINGVTVNWSYELNELNEIINLKCTNAEVLTGSIAIPPAIDGKTVVSLGYDAFKNSTGITEVIIPKTLKEGSLSPVFTNCTNLTSIIFEEGITVIPSNICATTKITEVKIPKSAKEIQPKAFEDCTLLSEVDLGNVEMIEYDAFKGCAGLENIVIPKTLKEGPLSPAFTDCDNLTNITFEEGITVIPSNICATTKITEVTIPNSVIEIEVNTFTDCTNLTKITILGTDVEFGYYMSEPNTDLVFKNHNEDFTIWCYENSTAEQYAINHNIKYEYLEKTTEKIDTTRYISFPFIIHNGSSSFSLRSGVYDGKYEMYYQFVEVSDEVYNKIEELNDKYEKDEITYEEYFVQYDATVTRYNDNNWTKTEDGSFEQDLSKFTGTKKFALWVKLVMEDKTIYEPQIYTMNGSGATSNVPEETDDFDEEKKDTDTKKDNTTAPGSIPYTGGTFTIIASVVAIIGIGIYAYKRNNDLKGI